MKKKISQKALLALIALSTSAYLAACSSDNENTDVESNSVKSSESSTASSERVEEKSNRGNSSELGAQLLPLNSTPEMGFLAKENKDAKESMRVYFDFACPECYNYENANKEELDKKVESGELELVLVPIPFLDDYTADNYSTRATSAFVTIAEYEPDKAYDFFKALYDPEFFPSVSSGHKAKTTSDLVNVALKVGVDEKVAEKIYENHYYNWAQNAVSFAEEDTLIFPEGNAQTPTIVHNGTYDETGKLVDNGEYEIEK